MRKFIIIDATTGERTPTPTHIHRKIIQKLLAICIKSIFVLANNPHFYGKCCVFSIEKSLPFYKFCHYGLSFNKIYEFW